MERDSYGDDLAFLLHMYRHAPSASTYSECKGGLKPLELDWTLRGWSVVA